MIHLLRMTSHAFRKDKTVFELYGVDFLLDTNLNLWFIEANTGPAISGYSVPMEDFIVKMVSDHFEIRMYLLVFRVMTTFLVVDEACEEVDEAEEGVVMRMLRSSQAARLREGPEAKGALQHVSMGC